MKPSTGEHSTAVLSVGKLALKPRVNDHIRRFLENRDLAFQLVEALGSPLNIVFPEVLGENLKEFKAVLKNHGVDHRIFFAHKACASTSIVRQLAHADVHLDIASAEELKHGLGCGFAAHRLEATGPKNEAFLTLLLQHGVTINLDSVTELDMVIALMRRLPHIARPVRILARVSGFPASSAGHEKGRLLGKDSRFGVKAVEIPAMLARIAEHKDDLDFLGFSFHLDSVSLTDRLEAIDYCVALFEEALDQGLSPSVLDIGGGFRISYLERREDWDAYTMAIKEAALGRREPVTWQNASFGLHADRGILKGHLNSYDFYEDRPGALFLDDLLKAELPSYEGTTLGEFLSANMISLWLEPGRSLLDGAGITLAKVNGTKESSTGKSLVLLDMKRSDLAFLDQEFFSDPVILQKGRRRRKKDAVDSNSPVYFAGNLCLESDLVLRHLTWLEQNPTAGDLAAFINTAAYAMDFSATNSIMQPKARKVAVFRSTEKAGSSKLSWTMDENFPGLIQEG